MFVVAPVRVFPGRFTTLALPGKESRKAGSDGFVVIVPSAETATRNVSPLVVAPAGWAITTIAAIHSIAAAAVRKNLDLIRLALPRNALRKGPYGRDLDAGCT